MGSLKIKTTEANILLDGGLKAPIKYKKQKTIIKGDEQKLVIALASIVGKVKRDELMISIAKKYPGYGLDKHKGYGTREHYKSLKNRGILPIHRRSFLRNFK